MKFKKWILQFENENSPRGDLASDIKLADDFPNTKIYSKIYDYLMSKGACLDCRLAFNETFKEYEKSEKK